MRKRNSTMRRKSSYGDDDGGTRASCCRRLRRPCGRGGRAEASAEHKRDQPFRPQAAVLALLGHR